MGRVVTIQQCLMLSLDTTRGPVRGQVMSEEHRRKGFSSMLACAGINSTIQDFLGRYTNTVVSMLTCLPQDSGKMK